jgi:hypothetical protein
MIGFIGTAITITLNYNHITPHISDCSKTRSIPYWTTSVFSYSDWLGSFVPRCTPLYFPSPDSCSPTIILLQLLNSQFQFSNPLATNRLSLYSLGSDPWKTRVTCYQECVFIGSLPSDGCPSIVERTSGMCLSSRCVAMVIRVTIL